MIETFVVAYQFRVHVLVAVVVIVIVIVLENKALPHFDDIYDKYDIHYYDDVDYCDDDDDDDDVFDY